MLGMSANGIGIAMVAIAATLFAAPASASNVAKELIGYRSVSVNLNEATAKDCFIDTNAPDFTARLTERLAAAGLPMTDDSNVTVALHVRNKSFGLLGAECALHTNLSLQVFVPKENLTNLTAGQQAAIERLGGLPVILWTSSSMAVTTNAQPSGGGRSVKARDTVLQMIDNMVALLLKQRQ